MKHFKTAIIVMLAVEIMVNGTRDKPLEWWKVFRNKIINNNKAIKEVSEAKLTESVTESQNACKDTGINKRKIIFKPGSWLPDPTPNSKQNSQNNSSHNKFVSGSRNNIYGGVGSTSHGVSPNVSETQKNHKISSFLNSPFYCAKCKFIPTYKTPPISELTILTDRSKQRELLKKLISVLISNEQDNVARFTRSNENHIKGNRTENTFKVTALGRNLKAIR